MNDRQFVIYLMGWGLVFLFFAFVGIAHNNDFLAWWSAFFAVFTLRSAWTAREEAKWPFWKQHVSH